MSNVKFGSFLLIWLIAVCEISLPTSTNAQETSNSIVLKIVSPDTLVQLHQKFVLQNSDYVVCDSTVLKRNSDYTINYTAGTIHFQKDGSFFLNRRDSLYRVEISYRNFPLDIPTEYQRNIAIVKYDTATKKSVTMIDRKPATLVQSSFSSPWKRAQLMRK